MDDLAGAGAISPDDDEFTVAQDTEFDEDELASDDDHRLRRSGAGAAVDQPDRVEVLDLGPRTPAVASCATNVSEPSAVRRPAAAAAFCGSTPGIIANG